MKILPIATSVKTNPTQTQFAGCSNEHKLIFNKALRKQPTPNAPQKQTQSNPALLYSKGIWDAFRAFSKK